MGQTGTRIVPSNEKREHSRRHSRAKEGGTEVNEPRLGGNGGLIGRVKECKVCCGWRRQQKGGVRLESAS